MANLQKYTASEASGLLRHYERFLDELGKYLKFSNQDIDISKTHLNYNLAPDREISQYQFIKQRCSEVDFVGRKNTNVMCSWVVTTPKDLTEKDHKRFFQETYKFLNDRYAYGRERNVISAYVHMDETTPHMHYAFVPVVFDEVRGREKISAKETVNRRDLKTFHRDFSNHMTLAFGRDIGVHTGVTDGEDKDKEQLRKEQLEREMAEMSAKLQAENIRLQLEAQKHQNLAFELRGVVNDLEEKKRVLEVKIDALEGQIKSLVSKYEKIETKRNTIREIDESKKSGISGRLSLSPEKYEILRQIAVNSLHYENELQKAEIGKRVAELSLEKAEKELSRHKILLPQLQQKAEELEIMRADLKKTRAETGEIGDQFFSKYAEIREQGKLQRQSDMEARKVATSRLEDIILNTGREVALKNLPGYGKQKEQKKGYQEPNL